MPNQFEISTIRGKRLRTVHSNDHRPKNLTAAVPIMEVTSEKCSRYCKLKMGARVLTVGATVKAAGCELLEKRLGIGQ